MESRKIIIVDSSTNSKVTVNTDATTFGELKAAARAAGINYEDKDWLEGLTKTTPVSDDSLLPTNVSFKGQVTNDLVYMLTNTNKHIKSGSYADRIKLLHDIKESNLVEYIHEKYGDSYTRIKSEILASELNALHNAFEDEDENTEECSELKEKYDNLTYAVACLFACLDDDVVRDIQTQVNIIESEEEKGIPTHVKITDQDIQDLFN